MNMNRGYARSRNTERGGYCGRSDGKLSVQGVNEAEVMLFYALPPFCLSSSPISRLELELTKTLSLYVISL